MASSDTPRSLAALYTRRRGQAAADKPAENEQMGLLFAHPDPAPEIAKKPKPRTEHRVYSVRSLVTELRTHIEANYADTWVEGEISNCRAASSGHLYFTLKDGEAQLPVVLFRKQASLLRFRPEDGLSVLVRGSVSVYESRGQLQMIAEALEPRGEGALRLAFEQLKEKLRAEGLFDSERKRPLPEFPQTIAVITSPSGAVLRDIANICRRRHRCLHLLVYPAQMQGGSCADEVRAGLAYLNSKASPAVDLIVIARGGGSAEDLWGFNDEALARDIAESRLPVISAVGHETDFTIADFVADLRAPTPSAAAEVVTEGFHRAEERVHRAEQRLERAVRYRVMHARQQWNELGAQAVLDKIEDAIARRQQHVDALRFRMERAMQQRHAEFATRMSRVELRLSRQDVRKRIGEDRQRWLRADERLRRIVPLRLERLQAMHEKLAGALRSMDPNAVLRRGYALVFDAQGHLLRDSGMARAGEIITARLASGQFRARVEKEGE